MRLHTLLRTILFGLAATICFTGCATKRGCLTQVQRQNITTNHLTLTNIDYMSVVAKQAEKDPKVDMPAAASENFTYALMANNAYDHDIENPKYFIPGWKHLSRYESGSGLAFDLYERVQDGVTNVVIAFEGTNNGDAWKVDWSNNFGWGQPAQYREAFEFLRDYQQRRPEVARFKAVGHSLGGGIALNMSVRLPKVDAIVFNASPRAFTNDKYQPGHERIHFCEVGEALSFLSAKWLRLRFSCKGHEGEDYTAYLNNFMDFRWFSLSPIKEHSVYRLSRALLWMAASHGNEEAIEALEQTMGQKFVRVPPKG